jgi:ribosomal protein S11
MTIRLICTNNNTRLILSQTRRGTPANRVRSAIALNIGGTTGVLGRALAPAILFQYTTGMLGFKGATRSSIYAAENLFKKFVSRLHTSKLSSHSFILLVKGLGPARNYILRRLAQLKITQIKEITSYPHNGCRKKKSRSH